MTPSQTFHDHIQEFRRRLVWVMLAVGGGSVIGYAFRAPIIKFLQHPLGAPLFYTSPAGSFNFILKVATMLGMMIALPLIVYHLVRFIEPALPHPIKRSLIARTVLFSTVLALVGVAFGFFVIIPTSLHFFGEYSSATIKPLISADEYLSFVLNVMLTFAALFQIPLVVLFINRIKPIQPRKLLRYQRHIVVGAFTLAVILPFTYDPVTQFVMAVPIVFLFYFSILLVWMANRHVTYEATLVKEEVVSRPALSAPVAPRPVKATAKALATSKTKAWQTSKGGLKSAAVLKTAVDVVKPGTISRQPLRLDPLNPVRANHYNLIDLSSQP